MTTTISFTRGQVHLSTSVLNAVLGLNKKISFSPSNIIHFSASHTLPQLTATRVFGLHIPSKIVGVYYSFRSRIWEYWNVRSAIDKSDEKYYQFYLKNERYSRIVIQANSDFEGQLQELPLSKYWNLRDERTRTDEIEIYSAGHKFIIRSVAPLHIPPIAKILFLPGSGPTDRNWNTPGLGGKNGSGKDLMERLAKSGFYCLGFDKLGTKGNSYMGTVSWESYLVDQKAALTELDSAAPQTGKTFVLGHSEGAIHAIRLYEALKEGSTSIAGLILLAPPGRPLKDIIIDQIKRQTDGIPLISQERKDRWVATFTRGLESIGAGAPIPVKEIGLPIHLQKIYAIFCDPTTLPYSKEIFSYDPKEHLSTVDRPVLVVSGGKDQQIDYTKDINRLREVQQGNIQFMHSERSNHVFKYEETPIEKLGTLDALAYNREGRVLDPEAVELIAQWLESNSKV